MSSFGLVLKDAMKLYNHTNANQRPKSADIYRRSSTTAVTTASASSSNFNFLEKCRPRSTRDLVSLRDLQQSHAALNHPRSDAATFTLTTLYSHPPTTQVQQQTNHPPTNANQHHPHGVSNSHVCSNARKRKGDSRGNGGSAGIAGSHQNHGKKITSQDLSHIPTSETHASALGRRKHDIADGGLDYQHTPPPSGGGFVCHSEDSASTASTQCASCGEWRRKEEQEELGALRKKVKEMEEELKTKDFAVENIQRNLQNVCRFLAADRQELNLLRRKDLGSDAVKLKRELRESEKHREEVELEVEKLRNTNLLLQQRVVRLREEVPINQRIRDPGDVT